MRLFAVWEPAHHFMVEPGYDVDVHMEHFLRSSSAIGLSDADPVRARCFLDTLHDLVDRGEDSRRLITGHVQHVGIVFLRDHQSVPWIERMNV